MVHWIVGSGKSTIANIVEKSFCIPQHTMLLDGDNVRLGLNRDLVLLTPIEWKTYAVSQKYRSW